MANASDIITYIGVPLAVLGVLPILYTFILAIFTRRRIRALLVQHGHKPLSSTRHHDGFTIRSSPMTTLIEVELPRYTITPLDRSSDQYWQTSSGGADRDQEHHGLLERAESTFSMVEEGRVRGFLRGGSWRAFHWRKLIVGKKLYRIQYEDELREPAAEIDFSDLVHFLLDWGAVPDSMGWEKLKSSGLWTPAGTVLLRKPDGGEDTPKKHTEWVLRTSVPDESDGVLSITIKWSKDFETVSDVRGAASLPPGWGRLTQPQLLQRKDLENESEVIQNLPARIETLKLANQLSLDSTSLRFHTSDNLVQQIHWEASHIETGFISQPFTTNHPTSSTWFTAATSSLLSTTTTTPLWSHHLPLPISTFATKPSIPCGILVLLTILSSDLAPQWQHTTTTSTHPNPATLHHQRFSAQREAERLEASMPPSQASIHRMNREAEARRNQHNDMMANIAERKERDERREKDAIASPKMSHRAVAEACLAWLIQQGEIGREWTVEKLAEAVLYLIVVDTREEGNEGMRVIEVLEEWLSWSSAGGMKRQQFGFLSERKMEFCFAASLVAVIQRGEGVKGGNGSVDMMECLRIWRKVRLG